MNEGATKRREKLDPERWSQLKSILADALEESSPTARSALVQRRCAEDTALLREARSLVQEAEELLAAPHDVLEDCAEQATVNLWHDEAPRTGWRLGAYVVVRELGRGGMGAVYLAARADGQFEKEVAIKVLKRGTDTEEVLRRFAGERHILARLDHPNIAHLLDAGTTDDGLPYFVMEYVAGAPVTRFVREHNLSIAQRLQIFLKICAAVEMAHQHHVIHRDLKPSNILVNAEGEPKLLDFGIAKLLGPGQDAREITAAAEQRLTPHCASPEQTDGRQVTEASDVYALGALLYEILSGQKPHKFSSTHPPHDEIVRVVREEEPALPSAAVADRETARRLRGDLDAIVLFAMRKEPEMRYRTVAELAADVRRHLAQEPVAARHGTAGYRAKTFLVRHRAAVRALAGATAVLLLAALLFGFWRSRPTISPNETSSGPDFQKSIAVLPFESFGDSNPPSYFADGVQDNILTDLAKVGDLKVISRSGVAPYRGQGKNAKQIGRELGVANVLEGSVQISGDRVRINAQLVDTRTETQIWAEHYDRKVEDIFALQSELAQTIVAQLKATLSTSEKAAIWQRPTQDLQAYDLYLRARAAFAQPGLYDTRMTWGDAIKLLNQAIARDPKFALAYCRLNEVHVFRYRFGEDHSPEDLAVAKSAAEKALQLQPDLEEARLAMARYFYHGLNDYRQTMEQLSLVAESAAHQAEYYTLASLAERRLGLWADSIRDGKKAIELDPNNPSLTINLMQTYNGVRRFADAQAIADIAIARLPAGMTDRLWLIKSESFLGAGNLPEARAALGRVSGSDDWEAEIARLWLAYLERDFAAGKEVVVKASEMARRMPSFWITAGSVARAVGDEDAARHSFEIAKELAVAEMGRRPEEGELLGYLAIADAALGNNEAAREEARRAVDRVPVSRDALVAPACAMELAQVLTWTGDHEGALELLSSLARVPFSPNYGDLQFSPVWDALRGDPRFEAIIASGREPSPL